MGFVFQKNGMRTRATTMGYTPHFRKPQLGHNEM